MPVGAVTGTVMVVLAPDGTSAGSAKRWSVTHALKYDATGWPTPAES